MFKHRRLKNHDLDGGIPLKTLEMSVRLPKRPYIQTSMPFQPGDLVNAKLSGYPNWPGIIYTEALTGKFYDSENNRYYVKFFDIYSTTSAWVSASHVTIFNSEKLLNQSACTMTSKNLHRVKKGIEWAEYVVDWDNNDRIDYFQDTKK